MMGEAKGCEDRARQGAGSVKHVPEQRLAGYPMQHLGRARMHALAHPCGEDDDVDRGGHGVFRIGRGNYGTRTEAASVRP